MYPMVYNTEGFELYCGNVPIYVRFQALVRSEDITQALVNVGAPGHRYQKEGVASGYIKHTGLK